MKKYLLKNIVFYLLVIPAVYLICICLIKTDYSGTLPGGLVSVSSEIEIASASKSEGSFNTIFVISVKKLSVFQRYLVKDSSLATVSETNEVLSHLTYEDYAKIGAIQKNQAYESSLINAYTEAHKIDSSINITYKLLGLIVEYTTIYEQVFKPGDLITEINGVSVSDPQNFKALARSQVTFDKTQLTYLRNKEQQTVNYTHTNTKYLGFTYYFKYEIDITKTNPTYSIHPNPTSGPSGGLMQTLYIIDQLLPTDLTKGLKIAGTGTMEDDGSVGEIGGIKQKLLSAHKAKSDVFLIPEANYEEGIAYYNSLNSKMKLYKISTLQEALYVLQNLL